MDEAAKPLSLNMAAALMSMTSLFEDLRRKVLAILKDKMFVQRALAGRP